MKTTSHSSQFKPSTYCNNVSLPLLERIRELEEELKSSKQQIQTLKFEKALAQKRLMDKRMSVACVNDKVVNL